MDMHAEWIAAEHHRLHIVEEWPEGPHKEVALAAIQSSLHSLLQNHGPDGPFGTCDGVPDDRRQNPSRSKTKDACRQRLRHGTGV
jgi:hypothetical protein